MRLEVLVFPLARLKFSLQHYSAYGWQYSKVNSHTQTLPLAHMCRPFQVQIPKATTTTTMAKSLILIWFSLRATKQNPPKKNAVKSLAYKFPINFCAKIKHTHIHTRHKCPTHIFISARVCV